MILGVCSWAEINFKILEIKNVHSLVPTQCSSHRLSIPECFNKRTILVLYIDWLFVDAMEFNKDNNLVRLVRLLLDRLSEDPGASYLRV